MRLSYAGDGSEDEGGGDHGAGFATSSKSPPHFLALLRFNSVRFEWVRAAPADRIVVVGLSFSPEISTGVYEGFVVGLLLAGPNWGRFEHHSCSRVEFICIRGGFWWIWSHIYPFCVHILAHLVLEKWGFGVSLVSANF